MSRVTAIFRSFRTKKFFAKSFRSKSTAKRAASALRSTGSASLKTMRKARGFKFSKAVRAMNRKRY